MCSNKINNICNFPSDTATAEYNIADLNYNIQCKKFNE